MALNYSHQLMFPPHQDNLGFNGYFGNSIPGNHGESFAWLRRINGESDDCVGYSNDRVERYASPDVDDIHNRLPLDPFEMGEAISGLLEVFEDCGAYRINHAGYSEKEYDLCADLDFMWDDVFRIESSHIQADNERNKANSMNDGLGSACNVGDDDEYDLCEDLEFVCDEAMWFHIQADGKRNIGNSITGYVEDRDMKDAMALYGLGSAYNERDLVGFDNSDLVGKTKEEVEGATSCSRVDEGIPHEALYFALGYLGVKDLLNVERVCKSFRFTVKNDPLLWRSIHIEKPLNEISDDVLLQLTSRAQGNLQSLSLLECIRITDDGLRRVVETNPRLTKLSVPGCIRVSVEGIVNILRSFNYKGDRTGIKHLRIGGLYGVTHEHVEELKYSLGAESQTQQGIYKPHFYNRYNLYCLGDDNRAIDVQECPRCENISLVYDCPAEGCQVKDQGSPECRACSVCIQRCVHCGRCINNIEYEETFCLELLCTDCSNGSA